MVQTLPCPGVVCTPGPPPSCLIIPQAVASPSSVPLPMPTSATGIAECGPGFLASTWLWLQVDHRCRHTDQSAERHGVSCIHHRIQADPQRGTRGPEWPSAQMGCALISRILWRPSSEAFVEFREGLKAYCSGLGRSSPMSEQWSASSLITRMRR